MGIVFAFIALFSWGLGDFLIQRSTRKFGSWVALFYITAFGAVLTLPFIWRELSSLFTSVNLLLLLSFSSAVIFFAALFDFKALKIGKISVVEPVYALELPLTAVLAAMIIGEFISFWQAIMIIALMLGILLVSIKSLKVYQAERLEKGVWLAVIATILMGSVNFLFGIGSRTTSPLMFNWFISLAIAVVVWLYLLWKGRAGEIITFWKQDKLLILAVSFFDNLAWVAFAASTLYIPIAIATGISESYIALAATLGLIFNHEKLKRHQWLGLVLSIAAVIILALITK